MSPEEAAAIDRLVDAGARWFEARAAGRDTAIPDQEIREATQQYRRAERRRRRAEKRNRDTGTSRA